MAMTYAEKLKDPRWQRKRLEILERDGWACQSCGTTTETLNVHHKIYQAGKSPWEYAASVYVTYCESCHEEAAKAANRLILAAYEKVGDKIAGLVKLAEEMAPQHIEVSPSDDDVDRTKPTASHERELLEILLAFPPFVRRAKSESPPLVIESCGVRRILTYLFTDLEVGDPPSIDSIRKGCKKILIVKAMELQDRGLTHRDPEAAYLQIIARFREMERRKFHGDLKARVDAASSPQEKIELLRLLKTCKNG